MKIGWVVAALTTLVSTLVSHTSALALNQSTHAIVNEQAVRQSALDGQLRSWYGLPNGVDERLNGKAAFQWIRDGGEREDDGIRFFRHFHDPLRPWAQAGLGLLGQWSSSIYWMQRPTDPAACESLWNLDWTWSSARCYFHRALTSPPGDRDKAWAYTFRALGQAMHLVVDASVPEHTRDDEHPLGIAFGNYEYWVQSLHGRTGTGQEAQFISQYLASPEYPDLAVLERPTGDPAAPVPVARLIDADVYDGSDPSVTLPPLVGIAEFANANFFSEDTGYRRFLSPNYPHPRVETLLPSTHPIGAGDKIRAYYRKGPGDGVPVDPALAECALDAAARADGVPAPQMKCTDAKVWEQTARHMLPRAVGYGAALLDYFFRAAPGVTYIPYDRLRILGSPETMTGEFRLLYQRPDGTRAPLAQWASIEIPAGGMSPQLTVGRLPDDAAPGAPCWLVFRGQLGLESAAVAGSMVDCPPVPAPPNQGEWVIYTCFYGAYDNPVDVVYTWTTDSPPRWPEGDPKLTFFFQSATGETTCSLTARALTAQPAGIPTEHPTW